MGLRLLRRPLLAERHRVSPGSTSSSSCPGPLASSKSESLSCLLFPLAASCGCLGASTTGLWCKLDSSASKVSLPDSSLPSALLLAFSGRSSGWNWRLKRIKPTPELPVLLVPLVRFLLGCFGLFCGCLLAPETSGDKSMKDSSFKWRKLGSSSPNDSSNSSRAARLFLLALGILSRFGVVEESSEPKSSSSSETVEDEPKGTLWLSWLDSESPESGARKEPLPRGPKRLVVVVAGSEPVDWKRR